MGGVRLSRATLLPGVLVMAVYFALGTGTLSAIAMVAPQVAPIWPPTGWALASLFVFGQRCWPGIFGGAFLASLYTGASLPASLMIAAGNTVEALLAVHLLQRARFNPALDRIRDVSVFGIVTLGACGVSALAGNAALVMADAAPPDLALSVLHWWIGDWAGALIFAPLVLSYAPAGPRYTPTRLAEALVLALLCAAVSAFVFLSWTPVAHLAHAPFLLFVFVLWAAMRFGVRGTSTVTLLISLIAVFGTLKGRGTFSALMAQDGLLLLALFCIVLAATGLLASAIGAHRTREFELERGNAALHQILAGLPVGVWTADRHGMIQTGNAAAVRIWGGLLRVGIPDYGAYKSWRVKDGTPVAAEDCPLARAIRSDSKIDEEMLEVETLDGRRKMLLVSAWPLHERGELTGAVAVHQDVTGLVEVDQTLAQLSTAVEQTEDLVYISNRCGYIEYVNPAFERHTGFTAAEVIGRKPSILKSGQHEPEFYADMWSTILSGRPFSAVVTNRKKNGDIYYESKTISPLRDKKGDITHFVSTGKEITDRIHTEKTLRAQALHQKVVATFGQRALEGGSTAVLMHEATDAVCTALGVEYCKLMTLAADGRHLELRAGRGWDPARLGDGRIEVTADCPAAQAIRLGSRVAIHDYAVLDGIAPPPFAAPRILRSGVDVLIPGRGGPLGVLAAHATEPGKFCIDAVNFLQTMANILGAILERTAAEEQLRRLNAELESRVKERTQALAEANSELAARNEELNAFAYSVSHDLRGAIRRVEGFSELLLTTTPAGALDTANIRRIERIQANAEHMGDLVEDLLHLSRISRHKLERQHFDLSAMALSIVTALKEPHPARTVAVDIESVLPAHGDPGLVRLVLSNLIENAFKFTAQRPDAHVKVGRISGADVPTFCVSDNGAGFDMRYADKLFKPFQRLHSDREFEGTGIGLSIVQRAIAKHGGTVWAESAAGAGARFYFTLPQCRDASGG